MTCEELAERLPDYWAGQLDAAGRQALDEHLASCAACREEARALGDLWLALGQVADVEPAAAQVSTHAVAPTSPMAFRPRVTAHRESWPARLAPVWQMAAAVLIALAGFGAGRLWPDSSQQTAIAEMRGELQGMRQMVALSLLQQESASERLRGVTWSAGFAQPSPEVLEALLDTLRHDGNVNVRLAAIDALRQYGTDNRVRDALVRALPADPSPLVQIALIDAVVALKERRSAEALRALEARPDTNQVVRQRARRGLQQLL
jgi:anti-sigma factor RsiW